MSNISDKDLDKLFRDAAEGYETSFDESAWEDMERRMDDGDDDGFSYFKILGGIIGILLLGSVVVWKISSENQGRPADTGTGISGVITQSQTTENAEVASVQDTEIAVVEAEKDMPAASKGAGKESSDELTVDDGAENYEESGLGRAVESEENRKQLYTQKSKSDHKRISGNTDAKSEDEKTADISEGYSADSYAVEKVPDEPVSENSSIKTEEGNGDADQSGTLMTSHTEHKENEKNKNKESGYTDSTRLWSKTEVSNNPKDKKNALALQAGADSEEVGQKTQKEKEKEIYNNETQDQRFRLTEATVQENEDEHFLPGRSEGSVADKETPENNDEDEFVLVSEEENASDRSERNKRVWVYSPAFLDHMSYLPYEYPYSFDHRELNKVEEEGESMEEEKQRGRRGFAMKIAYSPDLTSVGYFAPDRPGSNFGLMGSYFLGRWSISTGAIYSRKIYFSEESSGGGYYSGPSDFIRIDGDCKVIDIPLNISYYLSNHVNHGFYLTTGFSSYLMLKENYDYLTKTDGTEKEWSKEYQNKNNHFFSVLNLSIGYEHRVKNGFFVQLEPFVKAPVSGIGEGKVDLVSTGAFLNLMYKFNYKNK